MPELPKNYSPDKVEDKWYALWQEKGYFRPDPARGGKPYVVVIPPPNVTGILHMGHALNVTIQDILIRWKRMSGLNTLWIPGTDHAGIATQNVVERALRKEGKSRNDLGREAFVRRVWEWREQYGNTIIRQLKKLGVACDWERLRFTMDEGLSDAVSEVFVRLYDKKLIYRGNYIINWCPRCHTALSDEESVHVDTKGKLYFVRYPLENGAGQSVTVATTRPETLLGDTAVAVNPKDARYASLVGKRLVLPVLGRVIPVIADDFVDPAFGTGAVKVTPAHDPNDFGIGNRHGLQPVNVMRENGKMNENAGPYDGLDRFECRKQIVEFLEKNGLLEKTVDHAHAVGHCYRCDTVVEPRLSLQWFVKMKPLAGPAVAAVKSGKIEFIPERWNKVYLDWMENIRDWCISRQIWWGHRIPVFYCDGCGHEWAAKAVPGACPKCKSVKIRQDEDVLDTWFSSWLWPFSTLGWPKGGEDLKLYYPTETLVTASEIIFFWVARMIVAGFEFMGEQPFRKVYIHGTVRDNTGRKMSKSLGNSIDPQDIISNFSADALRFSLVMVTATGQDVYLSNDKFEIGRNFLTKLWNAARFIQMSGAQTGGGGKETAGAEACAPSRSDLSIDEQFILARLNDTIAACADNLGRFRFNDYAKCVYDFVWHQFCDWHIEYVKRPLASADPSVRDRALRVLHHVFSRILLLLHPLAPFITEELWHAMGYGAENDTIQLHAWPEAAGPDELKRLGIDPAAVEYVGNKHELIRTCRNMRSDCDIPPSAKVKYIIRPENEAASKMIAADRESIAFLLRAEAFDVLEGNPPGKALNAICPLGTVFLPIAGLVDVDREIAKHRAQLAKLAGNIAAAEQKLSNAGFVSRAPREVIALHEERRRQMLEESAKIRRVLDLLAESLR